MAINFAKVDPVLAGQLTDPRVRRGEKIMSSISSAKLVFPVIIQLAGLYEPAQQVALYDAVWDLDDNNFLRVFQIETEILSGEVTREGIELLSNHRDVLKISAPAVTELL